MKGEINENRRQEGTGTLRSKRGLGKINLFDSRFFLFKRKVKKVHVLE